MVLLSDLRCPVRMPGAGGVAAAWRSLTVAMVMLTLTTSPVGAQSVLERTPNLQGVWTLPEGQAVFLFAHRFELLDGADELRNIPTLTAAVGLPLGLTVGLDYTSNSEIARSRTGVNELEYWLKRSVPISRAVSAAGLVGYNSVAGSFDAAVDGRLRLGRADLLAELRGFSDAFDSGEGAVAVAGGAALHLTPYLALTGDLGRIVTADTFGTVWSGAIAVAIPGTPHSFSLQAANNGATTLQGASRRPEGALKSIRYGFTFTVPLGTASQWGQIFRPAATTASTLSDSTVVRVDMRQIAYSPAEIRVRVGQRVEWVNSDPTVHTVTGDDRTWESGILQQGETFTHTFHEPGRFPYHCLPHPMMRGVVVVEE